MMNDDEIDLTRGESDLQARRRERRERGSQRAENRTASSSRAEQKLEDEIRTQLNRAFDGLAQNRDSHDDPELADAFREEGEAMTDGFVSLTKNVPFFRMPLIIFLNVVITFLAFGRVGGILFTRFYARRAKKLAEQEQAQAEYEAQQAAMVN